MARTATVDLTAEAKQLIGEFRQVQEELDRLERDTPGPAEFVRVQMRYAGTSPQRLDELEREIDQAVDPTRMHGLLRVLKRDFIANPPSYRHPFRDPDRLRMVLRDEWLVDLPRFQSHVLEVVALAARQKAKEHPELFGGIEDLEEHQRQVATLRRRRAEIATRLRAIHAELLGILGQLQGLRGELERMGA